VRSPTNKVFEFLIAAILVIAGILWVAEHSKQPHDLEQMAFAMTLYMVV